MRWSDHSFVQTEYMRKMIAGYGVSPRRMTSVPMAVRVEDIPFFGTNGDTAPHGEKHIVYLGTLFRSRKMDFLVRAFGKVMKCEPRARLWLVGGGEDPKDERIILEEAGRLGIRDRVSITGFLPQVEAWRYVGEASVCVSPIVPSPVLDCGSPTKLIEYLAMGKASVANDHPEQSVVMAESRAGICVPYDENVFAGAILHILNHPHEAAEMGRRGRKYIESTRTYGQAGDLVESTLLRLCRTSDKARHET